MVAAFAIMSAPAMAQGFGEENEGGLHISILYSMINEEGLDNGFGACFGYEMPMDEASSIDFLFGWRQWPIEDVDDIEGVSANFAVSNISVDYKTWFGGEEIATAGTGFYFRGGVGYYSGEAEVSAGGATVTLDAGNKFGYNVGAGYVFGDGGFAASFDWHKASDFDWFEFGVGYYF